MYIDSHAHLEMADFDLDRDEVVARAEKALVEAIVTVGTNLPDCKKAVELTGKYKGVYAAIGIHPHEAKSASEETFNALKKLAENEKVVAWGEIGLDFYHRYSPPAVQLEKFVLQLSIAEELDLPVIIHSRDAHEEIKDHLLSWQGKKRGVIHCFSGDRNLARLFLDRGYFISIAGPVTFKNANRLKEVVRYVPLDRLLIETDAPFLSPHPFRGERNESARVTLVAAEIAALKNLTVEEVGYTTAQNARLLFGLPEVSHA
ncbi:MAG TPA: TatD family hydrolase [Syntrophales bacterium]|nr:TatD family hydrolase [Syntrophales bacterium]HOL58430.1 TatD family hydrolase [Syntrophales bacterium]HPO34599.1 TatD family hydrolase [Syntrophales bacterium]